MKFWKENKWLIIGVVAFAIVAVVGQSHQRDKVDGQAVNEGRIPTITIQK